MFCFVLFFFRKVSFLTYGKAAFFLCYKINSSEIWMIRTIIFKNYILQKRCGKKHCHFTTFALLICVSKKKCTDLRKPETTLKRTLKTLIIWAPTFKGQNSAKIKCRKGLFCHLAYFWHIRYDNCHLFILLALWSCEKHNCIEFWRSSCFSCNVQWSVWFPGLELCTLSLIRWPHRKEFRQVGEPVLIRSGQNEQG